jgi:integrase
LKRRKRELPKYLRPNEKDALFRAIDNPRNRTIFRLAYHHGLRASEIGMLQVTEWHRGTSLDMDRLFLHRLKASISGHTIIVNAAAAALRAWLRIRGDSPGPIFTPETTGPSYAAGCKPWFWLRTGHNHRQSGRSNRVSQSSLNSTCLIEYRRNV